MKPDISELSVEELKRLQEEAEALIASKKDQAIEDAYNQIIEIAENVGFSVEQLLEFGAQKPRKQRKSVEDVTATKTMLKRLGLVVVNNHAG
jgi:DNA-binding protein H-NS